ncbi:hypothetical protein K432DRAFT_169131 [Lepidopterella palustris CBS 459.81]|uniref:Uncharacterized protein n=1 Tax=Lepidopterella palustris CBS 459.81 TaxID=1314670 RepID=A0A8E2EM85_9PEZI|nr:hypothetical protein K432DRAFT_169131 [Lepidopterella palustris CBS 459.81]
MSSPDQDRLPHILTNPHLHPCLPILLTGRIVSAGIVLALGIISLAASSVGGPAHLRQNTGCGHLLLPIFPGLVDVVLGFLLLAILIPTWVVEPKRLKYTGNLVMLEIWVRFTACEYVCVL